MKFKALPFIVGAVIGITCVVLSQQPGDLQWARPMFSANRAEVHGLAVMGMATSSSSSPTPLSIRWKWVDATNMVVQHVAISSGVITNFYNTNIYVPAAGGELTAEIFSDTWALEICWPADGTTNFMQFTTNYVNWFTYPVELIGITNWFVSPSGTSTQTFTATNTVDWIDGTTNAPMPTPPARSYRLLRK